MLLFLSLSLCSYGNIAKAYAYEMPVALSEAGYTTQSIGKDHFGWNRTDNGGIPHGYQVKIFP